MFPELKDYMSKRLWKRLIARPLSELDEWEVLRATEGNQVRIAVNQNALEQRHLKRVRRVD